MLASPCTTGMSAKGRAPPPLQFQGGWRVCPKIMGTPRFECFTLDLVFSGFSHDFNSFVFGFLDKPISTSLRVFVFHFHAFRWRSLRITVGEGSPGCANKRNAQGALNKTCYPQASTGRAVYPPMSTICV